MTIRPPSCSPTAAWTGIFPASNRYAPTWPCFWAARRQIGWTTFNVAKERARPVLVVEVTSPKTRVNDVGIKVDYYHRAGVPLYVIADVSVEGDDDRQIELIGYEHTPRRYKRSKPDKRGRIWLAPVCLWLGLTRDRLGGFVRLACFDPDTGEELGDYTAISQALAASEHRRAEAEARAEAEVRARAKAEETRPAQRPVPAQKPRRGFVSSKRHSSGPAPKALTSGLCYAAFVEVGRPREPRRRDRPEPSPSATNTRRPFVRICPATKCRNRIAIGSIERRIHCAR